MMLLTHFYATVITALKIFLQETNLWVIDRGWSQIDLATLGHLSQWITPLINKQDFLKLFTSTTIMGSSSTGPACRRARWAARAAQAETMARDVPGPSSNPRRSTATCSTGKFNTGPAGQQHVQTDRQTGQCYLQDNNTYRQVNVYGIHLTEKYKYKSSRLP